MPQNHFHDVAELNVKLVFVLEMLIQASKKKKHMFEREKKSAEEETLTVNACFQTVFITSRFNAQA